jgi:hypothetical protein
MRRQLALVFLLFPGYLMGQIPTVVDPTTQTPQQQQQHFLTFIGSYKPENTTTAQAYYKAIDPTGSKQNFTAWLLNAGFISNVNQWNSTGLQTFTSTPGDYGYGKVNADAHVIVLNAADLGFVRNQYIRCVPNCKASNPKIYTYLENYPVAPFAQGGSNFSNLQGGSSYPTQAEAKAAINSALTRPSGSLAINPLTGQPCTLVAAQNPLKCSVARIADVAFEWAPPAANPTSTTRFGQLYSYIFNQTNPSDPSTITETLNYPSGANVPAIDFATGLSTTLGSSDPFAPNLDFFGAKYHPGVCFVCHGGQPQNLTSTGAYPRGGNVSGFRLLPLDNTNILFTSDAGGEATSRLNQESNVKQYNKDVLLTIPNYKERDDQGTLRFPHVREVILGWYAGSPGDQTMSAPTQNTSFVPTGWTGFEDLYLHTVAPSCRTCHFSRELSLDFGTVQNFNQESDLLQLSLLPYCNSFTSGYKVDPNLRPMPLAHLTFQRLWEANGSMQTLPSGETLFQTAEKIAQHFGFGSVTAYCATNP